MGYYIRHELTVIPKEATEEVTELILSMTEAVCFDGTSKSWDYENVVEVSKKIPNVVIIIDGEGEDKGDIWRQAWFGGKQIIDWELILNPPEISPEILEKVNYSDENFKRTKALAKLTKAERKALGL